VSPSDDEFAWLEQDIKKRLFQGRGEAFYELGVEGTTVPLNSDVTYHVCMLLYR